MSSTSTSLRLFACRKNNKEILEKRKQVTDDLDCKVTQIIRSAPGRVPAWNRERLLQASSTAWLGLYLQHLYKWLTSLRIFHEQMDKFCLEHQKRCVMWDDEGDGFYLVGQDTIRRGLRLCRNLGQQAA